MQEIPGKIHFIGIGGSGMSGIAWVLAGLGYKVTGSDIKASEITKKLTSIGVTCFTGHHAENLGEAEIVVVSTAIPLDNPELLQAQKQGIAIVHRGEMLAALVRRQKGITVAGTHGKTTTTSMLGLVLEKGDYDPTIIIGGELNDIGGSAKTGFGKYLVAEADESDGSFLLLKPYITIITNIEDDHLDHYQTMDNINEAFKIFISQIDPGGLAVLCYDDPNVRAMMSDITVPTVTYGTSTQADYTIKNMSLNGKANAADVYRGSEYLGRLELGMPGQHNLLNALAVVAVSLHIGLDFATVVKALREFRGVRRRYQILGELNGVKVIDDYAHHPAEIKATLQAARQANPGRVIGVFQPHRYTRTKYLYERFGSSLTGADIAIISNIYSAGEQPLAGVDAQLIVDAAKRHQVREVKYIDDLADVAGYLTNIIRPGDVVLTMGAGNVWMCGQELMKRLKDEKVLSVGF